MITTTIARAHIWTLAHQIELVRAFIVSSSAVVALDVLLVLVLKVESISQRTWNATDAHPHVAIGGLIGTLLVAWLVRTNRFCIAWAFLVGAHLFTH